MAIKQTIEPGVPPLFDQIAAVFPAARSEDVIFSWGDKVYSRRGEIPPALVAHEAVHGERQIAMGIEEWWKRYLTDAAFRLDEEKPAHIAEYQWWQDNGNRHLRRQMLELISKRLASPLYGNIINRHQAETILRKNTTLKGQVA